MDGTKIAQAMEELKEKLEEIKGLIEEFNQQSMSGNVEGESEPKQEEVQKQPIGRWKPKYGERYWYIGSITSEMPTDSYIWDDHPVDVMLWERGDVYRTYELAEQERKRLKAIVRVNDRIAELNNGWVPDWDDPEQKKVFILYNHAYDEFVYDYNLHNQIPPMLDNMENAETAEQIIREHEDDLKLIFGIEE